LENKKENAALATPANSRIPAHSPASREQQQPVCLSDSAAISSASHDGSCCDGRAGVSSSQVDGQAGVDFLRFVSVFGTWALDLGLVRQDWRDDFDRRHLAGDRSCVLSC